MDGAGIVAVLDLVLRVAGFCHLLSFSLLLVQTMFRGWVGDLGYLSAYYLCNILVLP